MIIIIHLFFLLFISTPPSSSLDLYVQSNLKTPLNGSSASFPLKDINSAFSTLLSSGGTLYLLPSSLEYFITAYRYVNQVLTVCSYSQSNRATLIFSNDFNMQINKNITFQNLILTRRSTITKIGKLFNMNWQSALLFDSCELKNFTTDGAIDQFIQGGPCNVTINNCLIRDNNFNFLSAFVEVWTSSILLINNTGIYNVTLQNQAFFKIWDPASVFYFQNSVFSDSSLLMSNVGLTNASFLQSNGQNQYFNVTFRNISLNQGAFALYMGNGQNLCNVFNISHCFFDSLTTNYRALFVDLTKVRVNLTLNEVYFLTNTNYFTHGALIFLYGACYTNLNVTRTIVRSNFALLIDSVYARSITFDRVFVTSHNLRPSSSSPAPYYVCYIESSVDMIFKRVIIDRAWSDRDVGGIKIHINEDIYEQDNNVKNRLLAGIPMLVNFSNCYFGNISSINLNWMDTGSAMSFHSNVPLLVYIINTTFFYNDDDKGATCMEVYGQNTLQFWFIDSYFIENTAVLGSPCLALYILAVTVQRGIFGNNSLLPNPGIVNDFIEGTMGGAIYTETNFTSFFGCQFLANGAFYGGALYFYNSDLPNIQLTIVNCTFQGNKAKFGGAFIIRGIFNPISLTLINSTFTNNIAINGGCFYWSFNSNQSAISISNSYFFKNQALKGGVSFIAVEGFKVFFQGNTFLSNLAWNFDSLKALAYGGVHCVSEEASSFLVDDMNIYSNNTSYDSGGVFSLDRGSVIETRAVFLNNFGKNQAGSILLRNWATLLLFSSTFTNETTTLWGGSISLLENSYLYVNDTRFTACNAKLGGVFYIENHYNFTLQMVTLFNNKAYEGGVVLIYTANQDLMIENCVFLNNPVQKFLIKTTFSLGYINFINITFQNNNCTFIWSEDSNIILKDSYFEHNNCSGSSLGCIVYSEESSVWLENLFISRTSIKQDGSLFYSLSSSLLSMQSCYIKRISSGISKGSCLQTYSCGNLSVGGSNFYAVGYGCTYSYDTLGSLTNVSFDNYENNWVKGVDQFDGAVDYGKFLYIENSSNFNIVSCFFVNNYQGISIAGGAIKAENSQKNSILLIDQCVFWNNSANLMGGVLNFQAQGFIIMNSVFGNNTSQSGGALYFSNQYSEGQYRKEIYKNSFVLNYASLQGGAIYFYDNPIEDILDNVYFNNSAPYGPNLSSFPTFLRFRMYNQTNLHIDSNNNKLDISQLNDSFLMFDSLSQNLEDLVLLEVPTGQPFDKILVFDLLDFFNQTINIESSGLGHISSYDATRFKKTSNLYIEAKKANNQSNIYDFENQKITTSGQQESFNQNGSFYFTNLTIYATPTGYINFFITNDALQEYFPRSMSNFQQINNRVGLILIVNLRKCKAGELYIKDINYCSACPLGKYSLSSQDSGCSDCPEHASCLGRDVINIENGYWRTPETSVLNIYYCDIYPGACLGGLDMTNQCAQEYDGPLCSLCRKIEDTESYTKIGKFCVKCLDKVLNSVFLMGLLSSFGILLAIMIKMNNKVDITTFITNKDDVSKVPNKSLLFKSLIDHIQFLGINENIGFAVPDYFRSMGTVISGTVYFPEQLLSFDCFIKTTTVEFNLETSITFIRIAAVAALPLFSISIIILMWSLYYVWRLFYRKIEFIASKAVNHVIASVVVTIFLLQPTILNSMSRLFSCTVLGNQNYATADMNMKCFDRQHFFMIIVFAIPCLLIWNLLLPLFCLWKISVKRKDLKDQDTVLKFGFMYNGFDSKSYYWGFVKYFQKVIIILIRMSNMQNGVKMLTILLIWILSVVWGRFHSVYVHYILNNLEFVSNFVNLLTLFLSMYLVVGVSEEGKSVVFILILLLNIYFLCYWLSCFYSSQKQLLHSTLKRIMPHFISSLDKVLYSGRRKQLNFNKIGASPQPVMSSFNNTTQPK